MASVSASFALFLGLLATSGCSPAPARAPHSNDECPPYRPDAEVGIKRILSNADFRAILLEYGVTPPDSSEVRPLTDAAACALLNDELAGVGADSALTYDPAEDYLSYFTAGDAYFGRITSRPPQKRGIDLAPPPGSGMDGYVFLSHGSVVVFSPDRRFVEAFFY